jgi:uncharacterized membrane protein YeaQ/YmgE (transglycosylase-associated protein family)
MGILSIVSWIVVGLIAGALAKMVVPGREPSGFLATTAIGLVGAVVGGFIWNMLFNSAGATGLNPGSILVAFIGAVVLLLIYHAVTGRSRV